MKVKVIIGIYHGMVDDVVVTTDPNAIHKREEFDKEYGIERDKNGYYESENDVVMFECEVDGC